MPRLCKLIHIDNMHQRGSGLLQKAALIQQPIYMSTLLTVMPLTVSPVRSREKRVGCGRLKVNGESSSVSRPGDRAVRPLRTDVNQPSPAA